MASKVGVWIDHKQAIIVLVTDAGKEIKKIAFDIGQPIRAAGGSRSKKPYKPKEYVAEDTLERKLGNDRKDYYDDVIATFRGAEAILILGPGEAKGGAPQARSEQKTPWCQCGTGNGRQNDGSSDCSKSGPALCQAHRQEICYSEEDC